MKIIELCNSINLIKSTLHLDIWNIITTFAPTKTFKHLFDMACYNIYRTIKRNPHSKGKKEVVDKFRRIIQAKVSLFSNMGLRTAENYLAMTMAHTFDIPSRLIETTKNEDKNMLTLVYDDGKKYAEHIYTIEEEK